MRADLLSPINAARRGLGHSAPPHLRRFSYATWQATRSPHKGRRSSQRDHRYNLVEHPGGVVYVDLLADPAGDELAQQLVQPAGHLVTEPSQVLLAFRPQLAHCGVVLGADRFRLGRGQCGDGYRPVPTTGLCIPRATRGGGLPPGRRTRPPRRALWPWASGYPRRCDGDRTRVRSQLRQGHHRLLLSGTGASRADRKTSSSRSLRGGLDRRMRTPPTGSPSS